MERENATSVFLGKEAGWEQAWVELADVQALWGGRRIHAAGRGEAVVQLVQRGGLERRYQFELEADEWKQLVHVLVEQDLLTIRPSERPGIPDEARPAITLANPAGKQWTVAKWAGVKDERFDAVYAALRRLGTLTTHRQPVYSGPYEGGAKAAPG